MLAAHSDLSKRNYPIRKQTSLALIHTQENTRDLFVGALSINVFNEVAMKFLIQINVFWVTICGLIR